MISSKTNHPDIHVTSVEYTIVGYKWKAVYTVVKGDSDTQPELNEGL